jgi:carbamoyl-phosphate synthase large subunit
MGDLRVLMTACGAPGFPSIFKSLINNEERKIEVIGTDMSKEAAGFHMLKKTHIVPSGFSEDFVPAVLDIAEKEEVDVIMPLATYELSVFSENKKAFEDIGAKVLVSDPGPLETANNKGLLYKFLGEQGIDVPGSIMADNYDDFMGAIDKLGFPEKNVCFKPQVGKGSRGIRIITKSIDRMDILMNHKPSHLYSTIDEVEATFSGVADFPKMVVMEELPGIEYSVDTLADSGKALVTIPRTRDQIKLGISFIGTAVEHQEIIQQTEKIVECIGLDYNIGIQFKEDADGKPKIIEINPRVQGTMVLATACGVNLPYLAVKLAMGEEIPEQHPKWGTRVVRYWNEVFIAPDGKTFQF